MNFRFLSIIPVTTNSSFDIVAEFENGIPFIVNKTTNNHNNYYVNLYPIINGIESGDLNQELLLILGKVLDFINIDKGTFEFKGNNQHH